VAVPPPEPTEFDALTLPQLKAAVVKLREETAALATERNRVELDRAAVEGFFELSKKELREAELAALAKVRETEQQAENHRVEIKVYQQKVKHLEYEQATALKTAAGELEAESKGEEELHLKKEALLRRDKLALRARTRHLEEAQAEAARQTRLMQEKSLVKLRQEFRATLDALRAKYEGRLASLREDLTLRHRVEVHEVEERKNLHLNQLLRAHEQAFAEIKAYYNNITRANLELITTLKAQVAEANEKQAANQRLMLEIAEENKRLSGPLQRAPVGPQGHRQGQAEPRVRAHAASRAARAARRARGAVRGRGARLRERRGGARRALRQVRGDSARGAGAQRVQARGAREALGRGGRRGRRTPRAGRARGAGGAARPARAREHRGPARRGARGPRRRHP
jgi:mRNA-degrading endonuclease HigB of HigAB toxin-antitoxin module